MTSLKSEFRLLNRGFKETLVLVPGWATDYRIFDALSLNYNYLIATGIYPFNFTLALSDRLDEEKIGKISLLGFSLGGFLAAEFAARFPDKINELILIGVRKQYDPLSLDEIKAQLWKNKRSWLYKFYVSCFSGQDTEGLSWFRKNLLKVYTEDLDMQELIWGLDYLSSHKLETAGLTGIQRIRIFHGSADSVAPIEEALKIKAELPQAKFIYLNGLGHIAFLNPIFKEELLHG